LPLELAAGWAILVATNLLPKSMLPAQDERKSREHECLVQTQGLIKFLTCSVKLNIGSLSSTDVKMSQMKPFYCTANENTFLNKRTMGIDIQVYSGESLAAEIGILADFRLRYFREFPYLYEGTEEGEREHIAEYTANPTARLLIARDDKKIVGVGIGTLLSTETELLRQVGESLKNIGVVPERFFYFGEMIFVPEYRHRGIGKQMLERLKATGRELGADRFGFFAVHREKNDARCPADHVDSEIIFRKFGFEKTDMSVTFEWATIQADGCVEKCPNRLDLWIG
jgi:GNAT superfamily N-acetyltransferase